MALSDNTIELLRAGDRAWLVDVAPHAVAAISNAAGRTSWADRVQDVIPAARSVLFRAREETDMDLVANGIRDLVATVGDQSSLATSNGSTVVIPVRYDGEDLGEVAAALGMTIDEVVEAHTSATHRVGFFGFAPGFAYIDGLPEALRMPRRTSPRARVAAGLVAIAGTQSVVYPGGTPGGWHLIGSTTERLWDVYAPRPNRLSVGDCVVFEAVS